jgi:hypothetical protein
MAPPKDKPDILGYATPVRDRSGPSGFQIFAGVFCAVLGLAPLAGGLLALGAVCLSLFGQDRGRFPRSGVTGYGIVGVMLLFAAYVMFRMSYRLFKGNRSDRQPG